jgi:transposase
MSKAYPSHLSLAEYEFLGDLLPAAKPGGRPRAVELWAILKAIFDLIAEGGQGRALPGDFPAGPTVYTDCRNGRKEGTGLNIHDRLREWVSIAQERQPSPSEACHHAIDQH